MPRIIAAALALGLFVGAGGAHAAARHPHRATAALAHCVLTNAGREICRAGEARTTRHARVKTSQSVRHAYKLKDDPRPRAWCGWWMRHHLGVADRKFNRALAWRYYGTPAHGPHVGAIVIWSHGRGRGHVGIITGRTAKGWRVLSGNDGHRVQNRVRSLRGAIAFRWPPQRWAGL